MQEYLMEFLQDQPFILFYVSHNTIRYVYHKNIKSDNRIKGKREYFWFHLRVSGIRKFVYTKEECLS